jgi:hypothetical protein
MLRQQQKYAQNKKNEDTVNQFNLNNITCISSMQTKTFRIIKHAPLAVNSMHMVHATLAKKSIHVQHLVLVLI